MSVATLKEVLDQARAGQYAVCNFDCFNVETAQAAVRAAEETQSPVILAYAEVFDPHIGQRHFAKMLRSMAEDASVPVVLHTDHYTHIDMLKGALDSGFTSVMIDASDKEFEKNVELTRQVVEMAKPYGASVESELGHVSGLGDIFEDDASVYTDPKLAGTFVKETGVDALAVSIGNVHGVYKSEPNLRFDILEKIAAEAPIPLVLHGASGISDEDLRKAATMGIAKVNFFTDLCLAAADYLAAHPGEHYQQACIHVLPVMQAVAKHKILTLR